MTAERSALLMATAIQWSGPLLVLGALLFGLATVVAAMRPPVQSMLSPELATLLVLAAALLVTSLPGMYAAQADAAGPIGLAGYALLQVGLLLLVVVSAAPLLYPTVTGPFANPPLTGRVVDRALSFRAEPSHRFESGTVYTLAVP